MQCGMARSWLIEEGARLEIMWRTLMLNINKRTKSSIEWLVYKPGLRRKSGEDWDSWWTTSWRVHNVGKKTDLPFLLPSYVIPYLWFLVFAAHGSERPHLYRMSTSPLSFLVVGVGQDFTCKWIGFRCEIRLITTACEQLDSCFPGYSTDCAKDSSLLLKNHTISQGKAASSNLI